MRVGKFYTITPPALPQSLIVQRSNKAAPHIRASSIRPLSRWVALLMVQTAMLSHAQSATPSEQSIYQASGILANSQADNLNMPNNPNNPSATLDAITITADKLAPTQIAETKVSDKQIQEQLIQSQADLVRYNPEVTVAEVGRYGSKGFAIRGVDGNRVAMNYDGVALPDQQINQVFSPYGYMFEGRFSPDTELLSSVSLQAGADSLTSGSGAVGGAVNYRSKQPNDILQSGQSLAGYAKTGYSSKNEEMMSAVGLAGRTQQFEALVNYAYREGHELKNHRMQGYNSGKLDPNYPFPDNEIDQKGVLPDPSHYESHASLAKLYWHPTDEHRIGVHGSYQYRQNHNQAITKQTFSSQRRIGYDESELTNYGMSYRYLPLSSQWIDEINADASYQEVIGAADTYIYTPESFSPERFILDRNEYRPQYDTTKQVTVSAILLPIETQRYGTHVLNLSASYGKQDHELIMQRWAKLSGKDLNDFQFIGPSVKKDRYSLAIADDIAVTDRLDIKAGIRYDDHNYKPYMSDIDKYSLSQTSDTYYAKRLYLDGEFDKQNHMRQFGGLLGLSYELTRNWRMDYQASTGFLTPSFSQMYSAFEMLGNRLTTNVELKPEKSLNHELSLQGDFATASVNATAFYSDYTDFINTVYVEKQEQYCLSPGNCLPIIRNYIMADNIDSAKTYGVRLGGIWDVSDWADTAGQLSLTGDVSFAKDSSSDGINLLATNPPKAIFGIDYVSVDSGFDVHARLRYEGAKKADDAKVKDYIFQGVNQKSKEVIVPYQHIGASSSSVVYDLYGSKSFANGFKLSAGIYNIFDKQYIPWSNLRSLAETSINSMVDDAGQGLQRYTAPGRNYAVALTYEF